MAISYEAYTLKFRAVSGQGVALHSTVMPLGRAHTKYRLHEQEMEDNGTIPIPSPGDYISFGEGVWQVERRDFIYLNGEDGFSNLKERILKDQALFTGWEGPIKKRRVEQLFKEYLRKAKLPNQFNSLE